MKFVDRATMTSEALSIRNRTQREHTLITEPGRPGLVEVKWEVLDPDDVVPAITHDQKRR